MKKFLTLIIILFATNLVANSEPTVKSIDKTLYILSGKIDNKYPITMYLTIHDKIDMLSGNYFYNNQGKMIYLEPANLDNNSHITLKEFYYDKKGFKKYSGEFKGTVSFDKNNNIIFKGVWSNDKNRLSFILKSNKNSKINEINITDYEYTFISKFTSDETTPNFTSYFTILEIANPKNISGINKINMQLKNFYNYEELYSSWKEDMESHSKEYPNSFGAIHSWMTTSSYFYAYTDNIILSLVNEHYTYAGGAHGNTDLTSLIYNIDSGELINKSVDDLIININDPKLITLLHKKLIDLANIMMDGTETVAGVKEYDGREDYSDFEDIRLNSNFHIDAYGITFIYNQYDIASYAFGAVPITFSYKELKPFVKKSSKLYYLFK